MSEALEQLVLDHSTEESREIQTAEVDEETIARLESLGYVVAANKPERPSAYTEEDDPKRLVHLSDRLDEGVSRILHPPTIMPSLRLCRLTARSWSTCRAPGAWRTFG